MPDINARFENRKSAVHFELIVYYDYLDNVVDRMTSATGMSVSCNVQYKRLSAAIFEFCRHELLVHYTHFGVEHDERYDLLVQTMI